MKVLAYGLLSLVACSLWAASLPDWAEAAYKAAENGVRPTKGDWILLDETRISLREDGRYRQQRRQVRWVLDPDKASGLYFINGDEGTTKVKKLKGWHRHNGKVDRLDKHDVVTMGLSSYSQLNTGFLTAGMFDDVAEDSIVAFESDELIASQFSRYPLTLFGRGTIQTLIYQLDDKDRGKAYLRPVGFEGWNLDVRQTADRIELHNLQRLDSGAYVAPFLDAFPYVLVGFTKTDGEDPLTSWDSLAKWFHQHFRKGALAGGWKPDAATADLEVLRQVVAAMREKLVYRQVYLTAERSYFPQAAAETERAAAGDCKDLSAYMAVKLNERGVASSPVLCAVAEGPRLSAESPPQPTFNHAILAVRLAHSLGLAAEVKLGDQLWLLFDPTADGVPLGFLPAAHAGRQVLICGDDGAHWAAVPEQALFAGGVKIDLTGVLERNGTLSGRLVLREKGDEWGLASSKRAGNLRNLLNLVRGQLDVPGQVDLLLERCERDANHELELVLQVQWPMFLARDLGAYRLPLGLFPASLAKFSSAGERVAPLYRAAAGTYALALDLTSELPLQALLAKAERQGEHGGFSWTASGGERLLANYVTDAREVYFDRAHLEQGKLWFEALRKDHNGFLERGPYFAESK